jgi:Thioredoxin-like domain
VATESPDFFWGYVKAFNEMPADTLRHRTDKEMYELVLEVAARFLTPSQLDLLRFLTYLVN